MALWIELLKKWYRIYSHTVVMGRIKSAKSPDFCQSSSQENGTEHKAYYGLWTLPVSELLLIYVYNIASGVIAEAIC